MDDLIVIDEEFCELLQELTITLNSTILTDDLSVQPDAIRSTTFRGAPLSLTISIQRSHGMIEAVLKVSPKMAEYPLHCAFRLRFGMSPFQELGAPVNFIYSRGTQTQYVRYVICPYGMLENHLLTSSDNLDINRAQLIGQITLSVVPTVVSARYHIRRVNDVDCDYLLVCEGREIYVHHSLLISFSRFFARQNQFEPRSRAFNLDSLGGRKRLTFEVLTCILRYLYWVRISDQEFQTATLLRAATEFEVNGLRRIVEDTIIRGIDNETVSEVLWLAVNELSLTVFTAASEYLGTHSERVQVTSGWRSSQLAYPNFYRTMLENPLRGFYRSTVEINRSLPNLNAASSSSLDLLDSDFEPSPIRRRRISHTTRRPLTSRRLRSLDGRPLLPSFSTSYLNENLPTSHPDLAAAQHGESETSTSGPSSSLSSSSSLNENSEHEPKKQQQPSEHVAIVVVVDVESHEDSGMTITPVDSQNNLLPGVGNQPDEQTDASSLSSSKTKSPDSIKKTYSYSSDSHMMFSLNPPPPTPPPPSPPQQSNKLSSEQSLSEWAEADAIVLSDDVPVVNLENLFSQLQTTEQNVQSVRAPSANNTFKSWDSIISSVMEGVRSLRVSETPSRHRYRSSASCSDLLARQEANTSNLGRCASSNAGSLNDVPSLTEDTNRSIDFNNLLRQVNQLRKRLDKKEDTLNDASYISLDISVAPPSSPSLSSSDAEEFNYYRSLLWLTTGKNTGNVYTDQETAPRRLPAGCGVIPKLIPSQKQSKKRSPNHSYDDTMPLSSSSGSSRTPSLSTDRSTDDTMPLATSASSGTLSESLPSSESKKSKLTQTEHYSSDDQPAIERGESFYDFSTVRRRPADLERRRNVQTTVTPPDGSDDAMPFSTIESSGTLAPPSKNLSSCESQTAERTHTEHCSLDHQPAIEQGQSCVDVSTVRRRRPNKLRRRRKAQRTVVTPRDASDDSMPLSTSESSGSMATPSESISSSESKTAKRTYTEHCSLDHQPAIERGQSFVDVSTVRRRRPGDLQQRRNVQTTVTVPDGVDHIEQAETVSPQRSPTESTIRLFDEIERDDKEKSDDDNVKRETDES